MKVNRMMIAVAIVLLPIAAGAATFIVPVAGTGGGANGSRWQTELTLHSNSSATINAALTFHDRNGAAETATIALAPRSTVAIADVVKTRFGREAATGAIEIAIDDLFAGKVTIASRTLNTVDAGEFGQDIPALNVKDASTVGDTVVLTAPANVSSYRFNAGIYAVTASKVQWDLIRADGALVKSTTIEYGAGTQVQYNLAVETLFGATPANSDALLAVVLEGDVITYGSAINNGTGDPAYVPGMATAVDVRIKFYGVDADLDGNVEIPDTNGDGVLDAPLSINMSSEWTNSFRVLVSGNNPKFELLNPSPDVFITPDGIVFWTPNPETTTQSLKVLVTVDGVTEVLTIPVKLL